MSNGFGKPKWYTDRGLVRFLQTSLGFLAGVFLAVAGFLAGLWFEDYSVPSRIATATAGIAGGVGLFFWIRKKAHE